MNSPLLPSLTALLCIGSASAQWSNDPFAPHLVAAGAGDQDRPVLAPTRDGGCVVAWFGDPTSGTHATLALQRLDTGGRASWGANAVVISTRISDRSQQYCVIVDENGHTLVVYAEDDPAAGVRRVTRSVDANGQLSPAAPLTATATGSLAAVDCVGGGVLVAWVEADGSVTVDKLDAAGNSLWGGPGPTLRPAPGAGTFTRVAVCRSGDGGGVLAMQRSVRGEFHLDVQRIDGGGQLPWGTAARAVFDSGSLASEGSITIADDGRNGAFVAWETTLPAVECLVQHVAHDGNPRWPSGGVAVATEPAATRSRPALATDTRETYLLFANSTIGAGRVELRAQRVDATGTRRWGTTGTTLLALPESGPVGPTVIDELNCIHTRRGVMGVARLRVGDAVDGLFGVSFDAESGDPTTAPFLLAINPGHKVEVGVVRSSLDYALVAWTDRFGSAADVAMVHALPDGTFGAFASVTWRNGSGVNPSCFDSNELPRVGSGWRSVVAHDASALATGMFMNPRPASGVVVPGFGELLADFADPSAFSSVVHSGGSLADVHELPIPADLHVVGCVFTTQALVVEAGFTIRLCNALDIVIGL